MDSNVLVIAWRRPHTVRQVLAAIRPLQPSRLFVSCDGPIAGQLEEQWKVEATRTVIDQEIDWPCEVHHHYSEINQGCRLAVSRAISWFFEHVDEGIILEDDCVPHADFFPYCQSLLEHYRHDERVWCISGSNFQNGQWRGDGSYFFSRYSHCWGWATWKRCWKHYDAELDGWLDLKQQELLDSLFEDPGEAEYWTQIWDKLHSQGVPDSWAYRWSFTCISNGGLAALPNRNLVCNIGFGPDATHTATGPSGSLQSQGLGELMHPSFVVRDSVADAFTFQHHFRGTQKTKSSTLDHKLSHYAGRMKRQFQGLFLA